jgi:hypothetical protein
VTEIEGEYLSSGYQEQAFLSCQTIEILRVMAIEYLRKDM